MAKFTPLLGAGMVGLHLLAVAPLANAGFGDDPLAGLNLPTMLPDYQNTDVDDDSADEGSHSPECARLRADRDADLGVVLKAGCEPTLAQMSRLMDNPIGNVAMMFNQYDGINLESPDSGADEFQHNYMMLFQFPKRLNDDWNLINRFVFNYTSVPLEQSDIDDFEPPAGLGDFDYQTLTGIGPSSSPPNFPQPIDVFGGRTSDLGDSYYVGLFSPSEPPEFSNGAKFLWGAGFDLGFDTAQEDILGTGKWTAGPSALGVYFGEKFLGGALVQHYWDYAGDSDRDDVNMTNIQSIYWWSLNETTSIGAAPNVIANWEQDSDNTWSVPIGIGISKTFQVGKVPLRVGLEYHHYIIQPDDIPTSDYGFRFFIIPAVPSALFDWMQ